jgi:hypothetical protein
LEKYFENPSQTDSFHHGSFPVAFSGLHQVVHKSPITPADVSTAHAKPGATSNSSAGIKLTEMGNPGHCGLQMKIE